jgi:hypothetical protein
MSAALRGSLPSYGPRCGRYVDEVFLRFEAAWREAKRPEIEYPPAPP